MAPTMVLKLGSAPKTGKNGSEILVCGSLTGSAGSTDYSRGFWTMRTMRETR